MYADGFNFDLMVWGNGTAMGMTRDVSVYGMGGKQM